RAWRSCATSDTVAACRVQPGTAVAIIRSGYCAGRDDFSSFPGVRLGPPSGSAVESAVRFWQPSARFFCEICSFLLDSPLFIFIPAAPTAPDPTQPSQGLSECPLLHSACPTPL